MSHKVRALVVDDTVVYRKIISDLLGEHPDVEVIGTAANGEMAVSKAKQLKPDLVTLDLEMPVMDGLEALPLLKKENPDMAILMVSAHTTAGARTTMKALQAGAMDFIAKPDRSSMEASRLEIKQQLNNILRGVVSKFKVQAALNGRTSGARSSLEPALPKVAPQADSISSRMAKITQHIRPEVIAIGISTGGPQALTKVIPRLPANLKLPVVIVQHMPPVFTRALADSLSKTSPLDIIEASNNQKLEPGKVYIAPGGKQMKVVKETGYGKIVITDDPPENHCKPSVDYLFRSLSNAYKGNVLSIIMTGMGKDGVTGMRLLKRHGAKTIAQDQQSCTVFGMPMEAIKAGVVDKIITLEDIAKEILAGIK
ncbi:MAG: chemotaxis response regulator protein-glutamate methylesterase [Candidatus Marinimicrobia bacterium]|nr:chemotaxis response regulator protein-glutamate methylesterase [Candidatus Neomarinimicrobiota bacterium]